jgi:5-methylcytosine-specific restriction endonuclease McrA
MATSRTGATKYLKNRGRVLAKAKADGLTHCPGFVDALGTPHNCGELLDYRTSKAPNSAETDHIVPHSLGGNDDAANLRVICRACNTARNRKVKPPASKPDQFPRIFAW